MTPKMKKILVALGGFGCFALVACGVGSFFVYSSCSDWATRARTEGVRVQGEADTYATAHDQTDCIAEGHRRDDACGADTEFTCHAEAGVFLSRCLDRATPVPGLCDGVPRSTEIMDSARWGLAQCPGQPDGGQRCARLMQSVQRYCDRR